jgi:hypothetical protein
VTGCTEIVLPDSVARDWRGEYLATKDAKSTKTWIPDPFVLFVSFVVKP